MKKLLLFATILSVCGVHLMNAQGKFSGYMFGDYYYNYMRDANLSTHSSASSASASNSPGAADMQAFQFRRIYLTYDNDISEQFTSRFRLEADQGALASKASGLDSTSDVVRGGKISVFVKDAYLKWKNIFSGSDVIFGVQPTPAYEVSEAAWGYRSLEKTIMDLRSIVDSRDMGISLKGKLTDDGMFNYWVMWGNGAGTAKPEYDKYKRYYAHIQFKPITNLQATLYYDYKSAADIADAYHPGNTLGNSVSTTALFIGYNEPFMYNIGFEMFMQSTDNGIKNTVTKSYSSKTAMGYSIFGYYNILPELAVVARYDNFDPNTDAATTGDVSNYVIAGLSWKVDKNVSIMPNLLYEAYQAKPNLSTPDPSITARLTLYYVFL